MTMKLDDFLYSVSLLIRCDNVFFFIREGEICVGFSAPPPPIVFSLMKLLSCLVI